MSALLRPALDAETTPFFAGAALGELRVPRCMACHRLQFPPRAACQYCGALGYEWTTLSGLGTVWSCCRPHPPLLDAYNERPPTNVIVVALDEDPTIRMVSNLLAESGGPWDAIAYGDITIDEPVRFVPGVVIGDITLGGWVRR
jgi:uncharacterized OB-fold protein